MILMRLSVQTRQFKFFFVKRKKKYRKTRADLYGSFSKGTSHKWSDIDLSIISQDFSEDLFEDRLYLMRIAASIDDRIELRLYKKELFNRNDPLVGEIQKNGVKLL